MPVIAHLSDLHIGKTRRHADAAAALRDRLRTLGADWILFTGDVTEHGHASEYAAFRELFSEFFADGKCVLVPGNHDRLGHDVARHMMDNERLRLFDCGGIRIIALDSTARQGPYSYLGQGYVSRSLLDKMSEAIDAVAQDQPVILALHHHLIPQPEELWLEKLATFLRTAIATELIESKEILQRLVGRCDLVLHGHRHVALETKIDEARRPLRIYNAGSSTELGRFRVFRFNDGRLARDPEWVEANAA